MKSVERKRISPTTIIACLALFVSLGGTGMAASRYLITSVRQIAPSVRYQLRGNTGRQGPQGVAGMTGAQGAQGSPGQQGVVGPQGDPGPAPAAVSRDGDYSSMSSANLCSASVSTPQFSCGPTADLVVRCAPGDHVLSGGFHGDGEIVTTSELAAAQGTPSGVSGRGWRVVAHIDPSADTGSVAATVLCAR